MMFLLEAINTENRECRYRQYTRSQRKAEAFARIPRIQFTDSGHGIVFKATEVIKRGECEYTGLGSVADHVKQYWKYWRRR